MAATDVAAAAVVAGYGADVAADGAAVVQPQQQLQLQPLLPQQYDRAGQERAAAALHADGKSDEQQHRRA